MCKFLFEKLPAKPIGIEITLLDDKFLLIVNQLLKFSGSLFNELLEIVYLTDGLQDLNF